MLYINDLLLEVDGISCFPFVYADDVQFACYTDADFLDVLEKAELCHGLQTMVSV